MAKFNVSCPETISRNWTPAAIDCYLLGCSCYKCYLFKIYFSKMDCRCRMKESVMELVRKLGVPENTSYDIYTQELISQE